MQIGPYIIGDELGRGAMGVVYRARRADLDRAVALKVIGGTGGADPKRLARFLREARAAAALAGTPGIVTVHDVGESQGTVWFAMDLVEGRSLAAYVADGPQPPPRVAAWIAAVARAVGRAHARGILHRDLKPANILVDAAGAPHVTDFGLAHVEPLEPEATRLTRTDEVLGTPAYMPPEQARAEPLDATADVYALGATAYELLGGAPPFEADSVLATLMEVLHTDADPRPLRRAGVPTDLRTVVLRCLEKDRALRYRSADELADDCERFLQGESVAARPASRTTRIWRAVRRRPRRAAVAVAAASLVLGVAGWATWLGVLARRGTAQLQAASAAEATAARAVALTETWHALVRDGLADLRRCEDAFFDVPVPPAELQAAIDRLHARSAALSRPGLHLAPAWVGLGVFLAGDHDAGAAVLEAAAADAPDDPLTQLLLGRLHLLRWVRALEAPTVVIRPMGIGIEPWREPPRFRDARQAAEAALARAKDAPLWASLQNGGELRQFVAGTAALAGGRYREAGTTLAALTDLPTLGDLAAFLSGVSHLVGQDFVAADRQLAVAARRGWPLAHELAAGAQQVLAVQAIGDYEAALGHLDAALAHCDAAQRAAPGSATVGLRRVLLLRQRGELKARTGRDAAPDLRTALSACDRLAPDAAGLRLRASIGVALSRALEARGAVPGPVLERTLADAEAATAADAADALGWITLGIAHEQAASARLAGGEDPRQALGPAIAAFTRALDTSPGDAEALMHRGLCRRLVAEATTARGGDALAALDAARADFTQALAAAPTYPEALANRAIVAWSLAEQPVRAAGAPALLEQALGDIDAALAARPTDSQFRQTRAAIRLHRGERAAAAGRDPTPEYRAALDDLDVAVKANRANAGAFVTRANVHWALGDAAAATGGDPRPPYAMAVADYAAALSQNPGDLDARYNRGALLMAMADADARTGQAPEPRFRAALADLEEVCSAAPALWYAQAGRGAALAALGRTDEALAAFEAALAANPQAPGVAAELDRLRALRRSR